MFKLSDAFVDHYSDIEPRWGYGSGPNSLGEITYFRTYSRLKPDGTNERWHETVRRVVEGTYEIISRQGVEPDTNQAERMYDAIFNFRFTPPGRGLWMQGTEYVLARNNGSPLNNCFTGGTKFVTKEYGTIAFEDVVNESVTVFSSAGWEKAEVSSFGVQRVNRVQFVPAASHGGRTRSNVVFEVDVTPDHRWILSDGSETTELSVGSLVNTNAIKDHEVGEEYNDGLRHGLVFGDGTRGHFTSRDGLGRYHIRLCGEKAQSAAHIFDNITFPPSAGGDPVAHLKSYTNLKEPPVGRSLEYNKGFVEGWIIADGHLTKSGSYCLDTQNKMAAEWLYEHASGAGFVVVGHSMNGRSTNFGDRASPLNRVYLSQDTKQFRVASVVELGEQEVFCAVVPDSANFTLANGLITGNCAAVSTTDVAESLAWAMDMSMLGVGVGFDTAGVGTIIQTPQNVNTFVIPDSREGWVESVRLLVESYTKQGAPEVLFDYSAIRPYGAPIRGFGGTASGPDPLRELHERIRNVFVGRGGQQVTSTDIVDLFNMMGVCVVAGNVRRTAEVALGSQYDDDFVQLKNYEQNPERAEWGWASNNTVMVDDLDDFDPASYVDAIVNNGEPGFFFRNNVSQFGRIGEPLHDPATLTNPCLAYDTLLLTKRGLRKIGELAELESFEIWNGTEWSTSRAWYTGDKQVYRVRLRNGQYVDTTADHVIAVTEGGVEHEVEAINSYERRVAPLLGAGDWEGVHVERAELYGLLMGDGFRQRNGGTAMYMNNHEEEVMKFSLEHGADVRDKLANIMFPGLVPEMASYGFDIEPLPVRSLPDGVFEWESGSVRMLLRGLYTANGYALPKHSRVSLKTSCRLLAEQVQVLLVALGFSAYITTNKPSEIEWDNGTYVSKESYDVNVGGREQYNRFQREIGFMHAHKSITIEGDFERRNPRTTDVVSVEPIGVQPVFDFTEPKTHWGWANGMKVHNCAEQPLESYETCCLVETYPHNHDSLDEFKETLELAFVYGKASTLLGSHDPRTNAVIERNRRVGTGVSGVVQFAYQRGWDELRTWLRAGYDHIQQVDADISAQWGVNRSIRTTTVKPSGSVSLLAGATPGVHYPVSDTYIRRIRLSSGHPLVDIMRDAGYHVEDDLYSSNTVVVEMPVQGEGLPTEQEVSVRDKLRAASFLAEHWSDNAVSVTVTFDPSTESDELASVIDEASRTLKSVSFLPMSTDSYPQMPYEDITDERYEQKTAGLRRIDLSSFYGSDGEMELYCTTDMCEIREVSAQSAQ